MVKLVDRQEDGQTFLCITDGDHDKASNTELHVTKSLLRVDIGEVPAITTSDFEESMTLAVKPASNTQAPKAYMLVSTLRTHNVQDTRFPLLGRKIIARETGWKARNILVPGEANYITGYWEWTEDIIARFEATLRDASIYDAVYASLYSYSREASVFRAFLEGWCPTTNTLHTMIGEFSISLWDLHQLSGLPILGLIYDEAVPSTVDMEKTDAGGFRDIPKACHHLMVAYHRLRKESGKGVTAQRWIEFWSKRDKRYTMPSKRRRESKTRPKSTKDPSGIITAKSVEWTDEESQLFEQLKITQKDRKQSTYLAAFLSCWLCTFVLPESGDTFIRPETFEAASIMAKGNSFSLAVPVLASIYRGLNLIATSSQPSCSGAVFPAHYIYSWLAYYFKTNHELKPKPKGPAMVLYSGSQQAKYFTDVDARKLIHEAKVIDLGVFTRPFDKCRCLYDDGSLDKFRLSFHISLRTTYLPLRYNGSFTLEPYTPYRFCKQLGFCQGLPGLLEPNADTSDVPYAEALKRWKLILFEGTRSRASMFIPLRHKMRDFNTIMFKAWWSKVDVGDLLANVEALNVGIDPDPAKKVPTSGCKRGAPHTSHDQSQENLAGEGTDENLRNPLSSKDGATSQRRDNVAKDNVSSDGESDTDYKHSRDGKRPRTTESMKNLHPSSKGFLDNIPDFADAPTVLALDGVFDLRKEAPSLIAPFPEIVCTKPTPGRGKEISKLQYLATEANERPSPISEKDATLSSSPSQPSVDGPNSLELAARSAPKTHSHRMVVQNVQFPAPTEATIVPEIEVKGILFEGLERATRRLLNSVKNAEFAEVGKIAREAVLIYDCMKTFKGNPILLREKIETYAASVRGFRYLEEVASARCNVEGREKDLALKNEELEKAKDSFDMCDRQYLALSMNISTIDKEIADLEGKLAKARDSRSKLASDANSVEISRDTSQGLVSALETEIADLEATPKLSADDEAVLEERRRLVLELQSSFNPDAWMDLVL